MKDQILRPIFKGINISYCHPCLVPLSEEASYEELSVTSSASSGTGAGKLPKFCCATNKHQGNEVILTNN